MDIRFLKSLVAVVETGSIAAAARTQNLTATAVSQRIRTLEKELQVTLLSRNAHSAKPTAACLSILSHAKKLIKQSDSLASKIDITGLSSSISIGAIDTALTDFIPQIVGTLTNNAPKAALNIIPGSSSSLYEQLIEEKLDCAITVSPPFNPIKEIKVAVLEHQKTVLLTQKNDQRPLRTILNKESLILYDRHSWGGNIIYQWLNTLNITPRILCELDSLETIALLVEKNMGVAIIPRWGGLSLYHKSLSIFALPKNTPQREIVFLSHHRSNAPQLLKLVSDILMT